MSSILDFSGPQGEPMLTIERHDGKQTPSVVLKAYRAIWDICPMPWFWSIPYTSVGRRFTEIVASNAAQRIEFHRLIFVSRVERPRRDIMIARGIIGSYVGSQIGLVWTSANHVTRT